LDRVVAGSGKVEVRESAIGGLGVFATAAIRAGEFIREYNVVREALPSTPIDPATGESAEHCRYVDGRIYLVGTPDRHFNHGCDPNAFKRFARDAIQIFSRRDIAPGSEITHDYVINTHGGSSWPCHCGADRCRGLTGSSFFDLSLPIQREYLPYLAPWFVAMHAERVAALAE
jgi:hypothetical protein